LQACAATVVPAGWSCTPAPTAEASLGRSSPSELARLSEGCWIARSLGLRVNAGHGLTYQNVEPVAAIEGMEELNIGHTIVARALAVGLEQAVRQMKALVQNPRRDPLFGSRQP
jgi:pyridoxine 5-phosphate synthase